MRVIDSGASYIINDHVYIKSTIILVWTLYHVILSDWANHIANILSGAKQALDIMKHYCIFVIPKLEYALLPGILISEKSDTGFNLDCKTVGFFRKISKEIGKPWRKSLTRAKSASLTCP